MLMCGCPNIKHGLTRPTSHTCSLLATVPPAQTRRSVPVWAVSVPRRVQSHDTFINLSSHSPALPSQNFLQNEWRFTIIMPAEVLRKGSKSVESREVRGRVSHRIYLIILCIVLHVYLSLLKKNFIFSFEGDGGGLGSWGP